MSRFLYADSHRFLLCIRDELLCTSHIMSFLQMLFRYCVFSIFLALLVSACANPAYVKKAPKSYPHESPQERQSSGSYISGDMPEQQATKAQETENTTTFGTSGGFVEHDWKLADNGKEYKIGKPYKIAGKWYKPQEYERFSEKGIASWYGPNFHLKNTANGGTFDKNIASAAHKTLPLPSVVKVTNNDNGRTILVKINDRGPYSKNRIIDLSQKAAQLLDFEKDGTANVQITFMPEESAQLKAQMLYKAGKPASATGTRTTFTPKNFSEETPSATLNTSLAPQAAETKTAPVSPSPTVQKPIVGSRPALSGNNPYKVQVGAFSRKDNAEKLKNSLLQKYANVNIVFDLSLHKVQVGFTSKTLAQNELPVIRYNLGFENAFLISP